MTIDNKNQEELIETLQQEKKKRTQLIKVLTKEDNLCSSLSC